MDKVNNYYKKNEGTGYKIFDKDKNRFYPEIMPLSCCKGGYEIGKWYKSNKVDIFYNHLDKSKTYPSGFHIFDNCREDVIWFWCATQRGTRKVKFRNVLCSGSQGCLDVVVAEEMMILPTFWERFCDYITNLLKNK